MLGAQSPGKLIGVRKRKNGRAPKSLHFSLANGMLRYFSVGGWRVEKSQEVGRKEDSGSFMPAQRNNSARNVLSQLNFKKVAQLGLGGATVGGLFLQRTDWPQGRTR